MSSLQQRLVREILDVLTETFERVQGIYLDRGTSLFETLVTVSAAEASRPVSPTCATLAAQVAHTAYYLEVLGGYMAGTPPEKVDWAAIWQTVHAVIEDEWAAHQAHLKTAYDETRARIETVDDWADEEALAGALAIIAHSAYHLGEMRQALCVIKRSD